MKSYMFKSLGLAGIFLTFAAVASANSNSIKTNQTFVAYIDQYSTPQLFDDNEKALQARLKILDQIPAGGTAKIMTFVYENGVATRLLAAHMCAAAKRGVNVQFMPDSKTGDRPGVADAFDNSHDYKLNEEVFQMLANCGVNVRIHNHIPKFEVGAITGKHIPVLSRGFLSRMAGYVSDKVSSGMAAKTMLNDFMAVFTKTVDESAESDKALLTELKKGLHSLIYSSVITYAKSRSELDRNTALVKLFESTQAKIAQSRIIKRIQPAKMRDFIFRLLNNVRSHERLGEFYKQARYFNRLNHRKLFLVENAGRRCMFLGGRNLGDHYLTWDRHHDEFMDADVFICNSHLDGQSGDREVTAQAVNSFNELFVNRDKFDPVQAPPLISLVKPAPQFNFEYLGTPYREGLYLGIHKFVRTAAPPHGILRWQALERPTEWPDERPIEGKSITGGYNWRVQTSTWDVKKDAVRAELYRAIDSELELVYIETAYSEFSTTFRSKLEGALKRGIPVHIVTNSIYVSDAGSKAIRLVMARWTRQMLEQYPALFKVKFATIEYGHMIHFKGANFQCQKSGNRAFRLNLVGSHNFHGRSGYSDKEHAIFWEQGPRESCLVKASVTGVVIDDADLRDMRNKFYRDISAKAAPLRPLKSYATLEEELQDGIRSGKLSAKRAQLSRHLLNALYAKELQANGQYAFKRDAKGRALLKVHDEFLGFLELLAESGFSDIVGALL